MQAKRNILLFPVKKSVQVGHKSDASQWGMGGLVTQNQVPCQTKACRVPNKNTSPPKTLHDIFNPRGPVISDMHLA